MARNSFYFFECLDGLMIIDDHVAYHVGNLYFVHSCTGEVSKVFNPVGYYSSKALFAIYFILRYKIYYRKPYFVWYAYLGFFIVYQLRILDHSSLHLFISQPIHPDNSVQLPMHLHSETFTRFYVLITDSAEILITNPIWRPGFTASINHRLNHD